MHIKWQKDRLTLTKAICIFESQVFFASDWYTDWSVGSALDLLTKKLARVERWSIDWEREFVLVFHDSLNGVFLRILLLGPTRFVGQP